MSLKKRYFRHAKSFALTAFLMSVSIFSTDCQSQPTLERNQEGTQLVLEVESKGDATTDASNAARIAEIIGRRLDEFGIMNKTISIRPDFRIVIQLPDNSMTDRAVDLITKPATFVMKLVDEANMKRGIPSTIPKGDEILEMKVKNRETGMVTTTPMLLKKQALVTGDLLTDVRAEINATLDEPYLAFEFNNEGARILDKITMGNIGNRLAIIIDNSIYSAPVIRERITGGEATITGAFSMDEAEDLSILLKTGSFPATVKLIERRGLAKTMPRGGTESQGEPERGFEMVGVGMSELSVFVPILVLILILASPKLVRRLRRFGPKKASSLSVRGDATRYLIASALLQGSSFRRQWLDYVNQTHKTLAPELGVDLPLLIKVCKYLEDRETRYQAIFFGISFGFLLVLLIAVGDSYDAEERIITIALVFFVVAWIARVYKGYVEQTWATSFLKWDKYDPDAISKRFSTTVDPEITSALPQDHNLIIYSGFVPFVGAGIDLGGWSFAVDTSHPKQDLGQKEDVLPFSFEDLYSELDRSLNKLAIKGLKTQDALFVNGNAIRDEKWILPDVHGRPVHRVDVETIKRFIDTNDLRIRHYRWIQIHDWADQLVVSYFLRCSRQGKSLFVDVSVFLLTPLEDRYCGIDALVSPGWRQRVREGIGYLFVTPFTVLYSWVDLFAKFSEWVADFLGTKERRIRREIDNNPFFDFGTGSSLRGKMSSSQYSHFFQRSDKEMYAKIVERTLLDGIVAFLDDHNIDTSDLKERQTTIINSGIIVQGGDVRAQAMAVGTAAQAATGRKFSVRKK